MVESAKQVFSAVKEVKSLTIGGRVEGLVLARGEGVKVLADNDKRTEVGRELLNKSGRLLVVHGDGRVVEGMLAVAGDLGN